MLQTIGENGPPGALRPTARDGFLDVFFCHQKIAQIDLHKEAGTD
jgi:hypothetical protein